ncbi:MAG TPA: hypothetical protein VJI32_00440 [Candidatus Nanoarchaeia archaeon]|nr:hypothetical protein [Candidatus Nanoarchaeia archaeon]
MHLPQLYDSSKFLHVQDISLTDDTKLLLAQAEKVYWENFDGKTWYGRCIFISWYCSLGDCTFCFRSTNQHKEMHPATSRRSMGSVLIEALFSRIFKWRIEFVTGGYGIMPFADVLEIIRNVSIVYGEKVWLNLGVLPKAHLQECLPYVKGIYGSLETVTPGLHEHVCPSKPLAPYEYMFTNLDPSLKRSICIIVGMGDTIEDMKYLFDFVEKYKIDRVTMYALKPVRGTEYTHGPSSDEYFQWIARLRIRFPKLQIVAGTNLRRCEEVGYLMQAGANAVTKFPATKQFGTKKAHLADTLIREQQRNFISNITTFVDIDWNAEIEALAIDEKHKVEMKEKIVPYLHRFRNPKDKDHAFWDEE